MMKDLDINHEEKSPVILDKCVKCGKDSPYPKGYDINNRNMYIKDYGQLCIDCFKEKQNQNKL